MSFCFKALVSGQFHGPQTHFSLGSELKKRQTEAEARRLGSDSLMVLRDVEVCAAHKQLSMWRQIWLHTKMSGMQQRAAPSQPCQAPVSHGWVDMLCWCHTTGMITQTSHLFPAPFTDIISMAINSQNCYCVTTSYSSQKSLDNGTNSR